MAVYTYKEIYMLKEWKIEGSEKVGSHWELNPGHLVWTTSAVPMSYDNQTTTNTHNSLRICIARAVLNASVAGVFTFLYFCLTSESLHFQDDTEILTI